MASFQIHQDADKENPQQIGHIKQSFGGGVIAAKQPLALIGGNGNMTRILAGGGNGKLALREVSNTNNNVRAENIKDVAELKKSFVPVEQFKAFSVYEDITISTNGTVEKENLDPPAEQSITDVHKDFSLSKVDYVLDGTPMSVSDVLSPMSVDRSQLNISAVDIITTDTSLKVDGPPSYKEEIPRNDRQRFFEVVEYQQSILEYFRESEKKHRPKPHYMRRQTDINHAMRTILVDWLVEVSEEYNLDTETLYLSVSYIDRFLSHMSVVRNKLQLVGTAAMYIASKYEEIYPPDVSEFVFITDDTYTKTQVLRMEQIILKILAFDLCTPTTLAFINTYAVLYDMPDTVKFLTQYISELSLLEADPYLRFYPSMISSASLALANYLLGKPMWSAELEEITTYRLEDLKELILCLSKSHSAAADLTQQAIQDKYKSDKFKKVSKIEPIDLTESQFDEIVMKHNENLRNEQREKEQQQLKSKEINADGSTPKGNLFLFNF